MVIKNLTNKQQEFKVKKLSGDRDTYSIYLQPNSSTILESAVLLSPEKYKGILEIEGLLSTSIPEKVKEIKTTKPVEVETTVLEDTEELEEEVVESKEADNFICDICGAEFASARGLNTHKNKAHNES